MDYSGLIKRLRLSWPKQEEAAAAIEALVTERGTAEGRAGAAEKSASDLQRQVEMLREQLSELEPLRAKVADLAAVRELLATAQQAVLVLQRKLEAHQAEPVLGYAIFAAGVVAPVALEADEAGVARFLAVHGDRFKPTPLIAKR